MARPPATETKAAARRRLTEEMQRLGTKIDGTKPGAPARLELLRQQASLSDAREALSSDRH